MKKLKTKIKVNIKKAAKQNTFVAVLIFVAFAVVCLGGYFYSKHNNAFNVNVILENELSIHFLELGNKYTGDCTLIKVGNTEILIDAGSNESSIPTIKSYIDNFCTDKILEFVIVTHAHEDHYAGFATAQNVQSIFDLYQCDIVIDFPKTNKDVSSSTLYANYTRELEEVVARGAKHYTALDCVQETNGAKSSYLLENNVTLNILNSYFYTNTDASENNYSVCTMITKDNDNFLFTGDLEAKGEKHLTEMNDLPKVKLYKAAHHGSKTSSSANFLKIIQPEIICVCCCAGSSQYTNKSENQFPTQIFVNNVSLYTDKVYVTTLCENYKLNKFMAMNGNIVFCKSSDTEKMYFSGNNKKLKDTQWFKQNRDVPLEWAG